MDPPPSSCRSTKWAPLAYPSSSLFSVSKGGDDDDENKMRKRHNHHHHHHEGKSSWLVLNSYFPLHADVILAAVREMLILDGSLDKDTLAVITRIGSSSSSEKNKTIISDPSSSFQPSSNNTSMRRRGAKRKRDRETTSENANLGYLRHLQLPTNSSLSGTSESTVPSNRMMMMMEQTEQSNHDDDQSQANNIVIPPTAETLADCILKRTYLRKHEIGLQFGLDDRSSQDDDDLPSKKVMKKQGQRQMSDTAYPYDPLPDNDNDNNNNKANNNNNKPPRKVSDADEKKGPDITTYRSTAAFHGLSAPLALVSSNTPSGTLDNLHSIIFDKNNNTTTKMVDEQTILQTKDDLPDLLQLSICVESYLRKLTHHMVIKMTQTFHDKTLRAFLGYKSSMLKRDKLIQKIADYLFDVSHALFAWEQTETELVKTSNHTTMMTMTNHANAQNDVIDDDADLELDQQPRKSVKITPFMVSSIVKKKTDPIVRDMLFDDKALKHIGGCGAPSLFMHALSIGRLSVNKISWDDYAKTGIGKKMLKHHRDNQAVTVGRNRRLQRSRHWKKIDYHLASESPSASTQNVTIHSSDEGIIDLTTRSSSPGRPFHQQSNSHKYNHDGEIIKTPNFVPLGGTPITLTRKVGNSWGILLAKEESFCVVLRVNNETQICKVGGECLKEGDLITSIRNECNETINVALLSSTYHSCHKSEQSNWFKDVISLFKRSHTLHLKVQRIHSHHNPSIY